LDGLGKLLPVLFQGTARGPQFLVQVIERVRRVDAAGLGPQRVPVLALGQYLLALLVVEVPELVDEGLRLVLVLGLEERGPGDGGLGRVLDELLLNVVQTADQLKVLVVGRPLGVDPLGHDLADRRALLRATSTRRTAGWRPEVTATAGARTGR